MMYYVTKIPPIHVINSPDGIKKKYGNQEQFVRLAQEVKDKNSMSTILRFTFVALKESKKKKKKKREHGNKV